MTRAALSLRRKITTMSWFDSPNLSILSSRKTAHRSRMVSQFETLAMQQARSYADAVGRPASYVPLDGRSENRFRRPAEPRRAIALFHEMLLLSL